MARHIVNPAFVTPSDLGDLMGSVLTCSGPEEWVFDESTCTLSFYVGPEMVHKKVYPSVSAFEDDLYFQSENR